ncbi:MAG: TetR/AcrR family transcriptional regulator [Mariprofundus sp.]|nr:TetR/AcrR family transcriptional regulator [Mariprofundus sp.]
MDTQSLILDATDRRFGDYGYNKTTMAEIAADCSMSVGNLYRHFKNKETIVVATMQRLLQGKLDAGIDAAAAQNDPLDALSAFLLTRLRQGYAHFAETRHLFEMMELIQRRHYELLLTFENDVISALTLIIERGISDGRFHCLDAHQTAYTIHQATLRYNHPMSLKNNSLKLLEADLKELIALFFLGLSPRSNHAA